MALSKRFFSHLKPLFALNPNPNPNTNPNPIPIPSLIRRHIHLNPAFKPKSLFLTETVRNLHHRIQSLILGGDLDAASKLLVSSVSCPNPGRHPTAYTADTLLEAFLFSGRPADAVSLYRSISAARPSFPATVTTHKAVLRSYLNAGQPNAAFDHYERLVKFVEPFNRSLGTFQTLVEGLLNNDRPDLAIKVKDDMLVRVFTGPDIEVYEWITRWFVDHGQPARGLDLVRELKLQIGRVGFLDKFRYSKIIGQLFERGDAAAAMEFYNEFFSERKIIMFESASYNAVLEVLAKTGRLDEGINLFRRMLGAARSLRKPGFDGKSFEVVVEALCSEKRFGEAIEIFKETAKVKCRSDALIYNKFLGTASCNKLIRLLGENGLVGEAEGVLREMEVQAIYRNEFSYLHLVDACFALEKVDWAISYFNEMVESGMNVDAEAYNKLILRLVDAGKLDEARGFLDMMKEKRLKPDIKVYEVLIKAFCEFEMIDDVLKVARSVLLDDGVCFSTEMEEFVKTAVREKRRDEDFELLKAEKLARVEEEKRKKKELEALKETEIIHGLLGEVKRRNCQENSSQIVDGSPVSAVEQ